jgi:hypothetical protein
MFLIGAFMNWLQTVRCPRCGAWFTLQFVRFDADAKIKPVVGHNRTRHGGGYRSGWRGGLFGGMGHTSDDPFIREFGYDRYLCKKCNLHLSVESHRDRK